MMKTENYINELDILDESFMELLRYHVSMLNACAYCIDMHFRKAVAAGESEQRLYSAYVWKDTGYFTNAEQALLTWTEAVTRPATDHEQMQQAFNGLSGYFAIEQIANLTLAIMQINAWTRLAKSFGFEAGSYQLGQY